MRTLLALLTFTSLLHAAEPEVPLTEASKPQANVPKGELIKEVYVAQPDSVFPGTEREYTLYLPANTDRSKPLPFTIFQDGVIYQGPVVFDNLIADESIPPMLGLFVKPGVVPAANETALPRFNRSYEYDSVSDNYAKFLLEELIPAIEAKHQLRFSKDPNEAGIVGSSSGGIAAYVAAWHRPDRIRRIFTGVGTYVGLRGGDQLTTLVRKTEPKPLKIFLQDGSTDLNIYAGDWWMANQTMERSLVWAGYEVNHAWGEGGHNGKHATQVMPEALRWLWKDWQTSKEIQANKEGNSQWKGYEILESRTCWETVGNLSAQALIVAADGKVSATTHPNDRTILHGGKSISPLPQPDFETCTTTLSPDQTQLFVARPNDAYIHTFQIASDGSLVHRQAYFYLHSLDNGLTGLTFDAAGMCVDTDGRLYVASALGIQVFDQAGRVNFIIPTPSQPTDVCFGGKDLSELFIAGGGKIYKRSTKVRGVVSGQMAPIKPAPPKL
jgi:gluconolactonase